MGLTLGRMAAVFAVRGTEFAARVTAAANAELERQLRGISKEQWALAQRMAVRLPHSAGDVAEILLAAEQGDRSCVAAIAFWCSCDPELKAIFEGAAS